MLPCIGKPNHRYLITLLYICCCSQAPAPTPHQAQAPAPTRLQAPAQLHWYVSCQYVSQYGNHSVATKGLLAAWSHPSLNQLCNEVCTCSLHASHLDVMHLDVANERPHLMTKNTREVDSTNPTMSPLAGAASPNGLLGCIQFARTSCTVKLIKPLLNALK